MQSVTEKQTHLDPEVWLRFDAALEALCAVCPKLEAKEWEGVIERVRARALASVRKGALARLAQVIDRNDAVPTGGR